MLLRDVGVRGVAAERAERRTEVGVLSLQPGFLANLPRLESDAEILEHAHASLVILCIRRICGRASVVVDSVQAHAELLQHTQAVGAPFCSGGMRRRPPF
eukprot:7382098-Prymnesium_polylepis.4